MPVQSMYKVNCYKSVEDDAKNLIERTNYGERCVREIALYREEVEAFGGLSPDPNSPVKAVTDKVRKYRDDAEKAIHACENALSSIENMIDKLEKAARNIERAQGFAAKIEMAMDDFLDEQFS